jgi:hypothetical protein
MVEHNSADENLAKMKAEKYHQGQQVDVYFDPKNPGSLL